MVDAGDVIENPATGQRLTFLVTARDTAGEVFRAEGAFPPGGFAGVEHIHPHQDEQAGGRGPVGVRATGRRLDR